MTQYRRLALQILILFIAAGMIFYGVSRGEAAVAFNKAINICFECIGLG